MNQQLQQIRRVFLDMDGTIYHGTTLFPTTIPFLNFLSVQGIGYTFLSNNSSYSLQEYIDKLSNMGIPTHNDSFYISTDYAIDYLRKFHPQYQKLYLLAMPLVEREFQAAGFTLEQEHPDAVVLAFDRSLTYEKLCRAAWFLKQGVPGLATHPDVFCPTDQPTWLPDCGAMTSLLEVATGVKLKVLGKPDPGMLVAAATRAGVSIEQSLMVGDRLATDIAVGRNAGALTCHITPDPEAIPEVPPQLAPHFRVRNLGELQKLWLN